MGNLDLVKQLRNETGAGILACQKALKETNDNYEEAVDLLRKQGAAKAVSKADRVASEGLCCICKNDKGIAVVKLNCETDFVAKNEKFQNLISTITKIALDTQSASVDALLNQSIDGKTVRDLITHGIATIGENIVIGDVKLHIFNDGENATYYVHNKIDNNDNIGRIVSFTISKGGNNDAGSLLLKQINMHIAAMSPIALSEDKIPAEIIAREKAIYEEQVAQLNKPDDISAKMVEGKLRKFYEESVLLKQMFVLDNKNSVANVITNFNKENGENLELIAFERVAI